MTNWPRTWREAVYRLVLLRRLTLVCAALILSGLVLSSAASGGVSGTAAALVMVMAFLGPAALCVFFPAGWIDAIGFSLAAAIMLATWPLFPVIVEVHSTLGLGLLMPLLLLVGSCFFVWLIGITHGFWPMGEMRVKSEVVLPASAEMAKDWVFLRPEQTNRRRTTGAPDSEGVFPVHFGFLFPNTESWEIPDPATCDISSQKPDAFARVIEKQDWHQVTHYMMCQPGTGQTAGTSLVAREEIIPIDSESCLYRCEEVHDICNLHAWIANWLVDQTRDYYVELADDLRGIDTMAVRGLPQITPLTLLARAFSRWGLADPGSGRNTG